MDIILLISVLALLTIWKIPLILKYIRSFKTRKQLLKALQQIYSNALLYRETGIKPYGFSLHGICIQKQLDSDNDRLKTHLNKLFKKWPYYSGTISYPVPAIYPDTNPRKEYMDAAINSSHWKGPYGDLRMDLLKFCITQLGGKV